MNDLLNDRSLRRLTPFYHRQYTIGARAADKGERVPFDRPIARAQALEQVNDWNRLSTIAFKGWIYWIAPEDSL